MNTLGDRSHPPVPIGEAARQSGVSARMVRHYEGLGLLDPVARTDSGYRQYTAADVHTLRFIKRARDMGFSMGQIEQLVGLWRDRSRNSASVRKVAQQHLAELEQRIDAMQAMQRTLSHLVRCCHDDERPECPILDDLAGSGPGPAERPVHHSPTPFDPIAQFVTVGR